MLSQTSFLPFVYIKFIASHDVLGRTPNLTTNQLLNKTIQLWQMRKNGIKWAFSTDFYYIEDTESPLAIISCLILIIYYPSAFQKLKFSPKVRFLFLLIIKIQSFCLIQEHQAADENNANKSPAPTEETSFAHPPSVPSTENASLPLFRIQSNCSQPTKTPFPLPIPPFPPVSPHLLNGKIPFPPPGWVPPPGQHIPIPPPTIPPPSLPAPPTFLRPPPPLMLPPCVPPPLSRFPFPMVPPTPLDTSSQSNGTTPLPFPLPPWPSPFKFNPFVPPPNFPVVRENPHKLTIEKVLQVIIDELKVIIKKDITRRMIEGTAFKRFEDWWECEDRKTKVIP